MTQLNFQTTYYFEPLSQAGTLLDLSVSQDAQGLTLQGYRSDTGQTISFAIDDDGRLQPTTISVASTAPSVPISPQDLRAVSAVLGDNMAQISDSLIIAQPGNSLAARGAILPSTVSAIAAAPNATGSLLFTLEPDLGTLTSFHSNADGTLRVADQMQAGDDLPLTRPTQIETLQLGGQIFLVVGAEGSGTLSVLSVDSAGNMELCDHVIDTRATRFANTHNLQTFSVGDRGYVMASGNDDGLTLFALLPGGRLLALSTLADTEAMALANISALTARTTSEGATIYAASASEPGLSQFQLDLSSNGAVVPGGTRGDRLRGGHHDDILDGGGGNDRLFGRGGNDILMDGAGKDLLWGGAGADVFVFSYDAQHDRVKDYTPGVDRLDLSAFPLLQTAAQLQITPTKTGAILSYGAEQITITSHDRTPLSADDFTTDSILNVSRPTLPGSAITGDAAADGLSLRGTAGADLMLGGAGHDVFYSSAGFDSYLGQAGQDTMIFSWAEGRVGLDLARPEHNFGAAKGDSFDAIEIFRASPRKDKMSGDSAANVFQGGSGADVLNGRNGADTLQGGNGADRLLGGKGADQLLGGAGADKLTGGAGHDQLIGGNGADKFIFTRKSDSPAGKHTDTITDFSRTQGDKIDLSALMPKNMPDLFWAGKTTFDGHIGMVRWENSGPMETHVAIDMNGNGQADFQLVVQGSNKLIASDFLL